MSISFQCAQEAIDSFVKHTLKAPYYPYWSQLVPGETTTGWAATVADWLAQSSAIIADFNACITSQGIAPITVTISEKKVLRAMTLATFRQVMAERANRPAVQAAFALTGAHQ